MKNLARSYVYWPNIDSDIENFLKTCNDCALTAKSPTKTHLHSWPISTKPWERIHIDYAGPIRNYYYLVVVDAHSKWPEIVQTTSTQSSKTIEILSTIFARYGVPEQLVSENASY